MSGLMRVARSGLPLFTIAFMSAYIVSDGSYAQSNSASAPDLQYSVALVLSEDMCEVTRRELKWRKKELRVLNDWLCPSLEAITGENFSNLTVVSDPSEATASQSEFLLTPSFEISVRREGMWAGQDKETLVLVEWTLSELNGATIWFESVQASATSKNGNSFNADDLLTEDLTKIHADLLEDSGAAFRALNDIL